VSAATDAQPKLPDLLPAEPSGAGFGGRFAAPVAFAVFGLADIALLGLAW
jgi:hypothetical protein